MAGSEVTYEAWEQLRLFPSSTLRVEVTCFLDGPTETATIGWKVTDADTDDVVALGVDRPCALERASADAGVVLATMIERSLKSLCPF